MANLDSAALGLPDIIAFDFCQIQAVQSRDTMAAFWLVHPPQGSGRALFTGFAGGGRYWFL